MPASRILDRMREKTKQYTEKHTKFRLPHDARFEAVYDATNTTWTVKLTIGEQTYVAVGSGIHWAFRKAGKQWWKNTNK
jgi:hypothetical protein